MKRWMGAVVAVAGVAAAFVPAGRARSSSTDPIALWKFDEGSGTALADASGNGNAGTLRGSPTWVSGPSYGSGSNGALSFNGSNQWVDFATSTTIHGLSGPMTLESWIKGGSSTGQMLVFDKRHNGSTGWGFQSQGSLGGSSTNDVVSFVINAGTYTTVPEVSFGHVLDGTWHHLAATYDGYAVVVYVDGSYFGTSTISTSGSAAIHTNSQALEMARWGGSRYFSGSIGETAIFDSALDAATIQSHYLDGVTAGSGAPPPTGSPPSAPTSLVASYSAGAGVGLSWQDNSTDETVFRIERSAAGQSFAELISTGANVMSWTDFRLFPSTTFVYRVQASNVYGFSAYSNEVSVTTGVSEAIPSPPPAPSFLATTTLDDGSVDVAWFDNSFDESAFDLERAEGGASFRTMIRTVPNVTALADFAVHPGWPCSYRVRALSLQGPSPWSNTATATVPATLDVTVKKGTLKDSTKPAGDKLTASGSYAPVAGAPDPSIDLVANGLTIQVGPSGAAVGVVIPPGDAGWKVKRAKLSWKSPKGAVPTVSVVVDTARRTFAVSAKGFRYGAPLAAAVRVLLASGIDGGGHTANWSARGTSTWSFP